MRLLSCCLLLLAAFPSKAPAARSYDNCTGYVETLPAVITTQGTWCLRQDLSSALSTGVAIDVDGCTLSSNLVNAN